MSIFGCNHSWIVENTHYSLPPARVKLDSGTEYMLRRLSEGVTHIYMRCERCGWIEEKDVFGEYTPNEKV